MAINKGIGARKKTNQVYLWFLMAQEILKDFDGELKESLVDYEAFRFSSEKVNIIFYYHRTTSTGNYSIRIRDSNSKDKELFKVTASELYCGTGWNNIFTQKNTPQLSRPSDSSDKPMQWAYDLVMGRMK